jgi:hypothetical protein
MTPTYKSLGQLIIYKCAHTPPFYSMLFSLIIIALLNTLLGYFIANADNGNDVQITLLEKVVKHTQYLKHSLENKLFVTNRRTTLLFTLFVNTPQARARRVGKTCGVSIKRLD